MCFSAWSSGCGWNRRVLHVMCMCSRWLCSTGLHPDPKSHSSSGGCWLVTPSCRYNPHRATSSGSTCTNAPWSTWAAGFTKTKEDWDHLWSQGETVWWLKDFKKRKRPHLLCKLMPITKSFLCSFSWLSVSNLHLYSASGLFIWFGFILLNVSVIFVFSFDSFSIFTRLLSFQERFDTQRKSMLFLPYPSLKWGY